MDRKCLRNSVFFFVLFFVLLFLSIPAKAQNYQVTQEQLQKLEAICQNYKVVNQKQELLVNDLQEQLRTERALTKNLNESLTRYENNQLQIEQEKENLKEELNKAKLDSVKKSKTIFILTAVITFLCFIIFLGIFFKIKKIF